MKGNRILLLPLEKSNIDKIRMWRNDPDIKKNLFDWHYINTQEQENWFERYRSDSSQIIFGIFTVENDFIGTIGLSNIDYRNQNAELGTLIGEKNYWGKGFATEALALIIEYAFFEMNLKKIYSFIFSFNTGSIRKNQKVGFEVEGTMREHIYAQGAFHDVSVMSLLKKDYLALKK